MPRQDPAYLYEQTLERDAQDAAATIRAKNARIAELEERLSLLSYFIEGMANEAHGAAKTILTGVVNQIRDLLNKKG